MSIGQWAVKLIDVSLLGVYALVIGLVLSFFIDRLFIRLDRKMYKKLDKSTRPRWQKRALVFLSTLPTVILISISAVLVTTLIQKIPFPLEGVCGYDSSITQERQLATIWFAFAIFVAMNNFRKKLVYVFSPEQQPLT